MSNSKIENEKKLFRDQLNAVSPSFCLAKWLQVTLHLHSGHNHSCHYPPAHKTSLRELEKNPSALHNTDKKKKAREKMLKGNRPSECKYCWDIENLGEEYLSERTFKSSEDWAAPQLEEISKLPATANVNPSYVEASFSNACNFRCSYCSGNFSTRWQEDINKSGPYTTNTGVQTMDIYPEEDNPYIRGFWAWWPDLVKDLKVFRITGGEPLLSKNTFRILEEISNNPAPHLEIAINSNLGISDAAYDKFIHLAKDLVTHKKVKMFRLFTSVDAYGKRAEYIRNGLDFSKFQKNLERFMNEIPNGQATIMVTFNALSLTSFKDLLAYVLETKRKLARGSSSGFLAFDISYLRDPLYQTVQVLPESYHAEMESICDFMLVNQKSHLDAGGFHYFEISKALRTLEWMKKPLPLSELKFRRHNFYRFFSEHDRRRNTSFLDTFPEMAEFWDLCEKRELIDGHI